MNDTVNDNDNGVMMPSPANSVFYLSILHLTASHAENFGQSQRKNYSALHSLVFLTVEMTK